MEGRLQLWWLLWALSLLLQHAHCEPSSAERECRRTGPYTAPLSGHRHMPPLQALYVPCSALLP